jgi:hypothetical protein
VGRIGYWARGERSCWCFNLNQDQSVNLQVLPTASSRSDMHRDKAVPSSIFGPFPLA